MKFGLTLPSFTWPGLDYAMTRRITKDMARRAEELGYDSITVWDHLLSAPGLYAGAWLDPLMVLSCAAGVTENVGSHLEVSRRCQLQTLQVAGRREPVEVECPGDG